jgi:surface polysaccharide O-acyltransferase-like enzyme
LESFDRQSGICCNFWYREFSIELTGSFFDTLRGFIMRKENRIENKNEKIESQLFQIKILLIVLIALCLLGFYGLSTIMDVAGDIFKVFFWLFIFIVVAYLVALFIEKITMRKHNKKINEELQKVIDKAESDKEKPES